MPTTDGLYIDMVVVKGTSRNFTVSIETLNEDGVTFDPFDLDPYSVRFTVLGSATADGTVLLQKVITQNTGDSDTGSIYDPTNGQFSITVSSEDTTELGLGRFPIMIELVDPDTLEQQYVLTEGAYQGEFSKLEIVQV